MFKAALSLILALFAGFILASCTPSKDASKTPENTPIKESQKPDNSWQNGYPSHWWKPVPREQAKNWEILPQDAGFMEVVLSKRNELGILSNFAEASFVFHGVCYPTVEAFWQMMKYPETENDPRWAWAKNWKYTRQQVSQFNGYAAKSAGNYANFLMDKNDANWVTFEGKVIPFATKEPQEHYQLIWNALLEKIRQNPEVLKTLIATKDLKLIPDHGISDKAPREWHYNLLWMDIRKLIQDNQLSLETQEDLSLKTCKGLNK
ncbi:NADAR family protein [Bdellovibrio sp. HCB274]|uniref:NADAR family protein n=1 Tax=Bdellovibrio sp. HCB274 TaxID=3394361 RepID=UPI0039B684BD